MIGYDTNQDVSMIDNEEINESLIKKLKSSLRIRNVSISVLVFVLLWILFISMSIAFCLTQVGFSEKYSTLTLQNGDVISTGFEYVKKYGPTSFNVQFESDEQRNAFNFSIYLWLGLAGAAFLFCFVGNILLIVLKKLNNTYDPDEGSFIGNSMGWLFKITGIIMFGSALAWIFGWFGEFSGKWIVVAIALFIIIFLAILVISLIIFTICGIVVSALNWKDANNELKRYNLA